MKKISYEKSLLIKWRDINYSAQTVDDLRQKNKRNIKIRYFISQEFIFLAFFTFCDNLKFSRKINKISF